MEMKAFESVSFKNGAPEGTFTARIVTFNKADKMGDIVRPGAFRDTLARWRQTGGKIPVIFSHASQDPHAFVGEVDPADVVETASGLEATGRFYLDEPTGTQVFRQLQRKTLQEWSYGYIVQKAKALANGARELLAVQLVELGPTLVGAGDTQTLQVKAQTTNAPPSPVAAERAALERAVKRAELQIAAQ